MSRNICSGGREKSATRSKIFVTPPHAVNNDNPLRTKLVIEHVKYGEILDFKLKKSKI